MGLTNLVSNGTISSPNFGGIIENIENINKYAKNSNDLDALFENNKTIEGQWTFSTNPKFGTSNGFLKSTSGVVSFETLADVATSNDYNDLDNLPSLATVATSGAYSDLTGTPTIPATLTDLGSPTTAFNFGNQELNSVEKLLIENAPMLTGIYNNTQGNLIIKGDYVGANRFNTIDFIGDGSNNPNSRIAGFSGSAGSFFAFGLSNDYSLGITHVPLIVNYYNLQTAGIIPQINNYFSLGNASYSWDNIYLQNNPTVTSDIREKIINEKLNLKKDFSFEFLEKMVKNCIISWKWKPDLIKEKKTTSFEKVTRKNKETGIDEIDYILTTKILEPEKIIEHKRNHIGLNLNELYKLMTEFNMSTKDYAFLSINDTYEVESFDSEGVEIIETKNSFDENGDPILDELGYPLGKLTYKPQELQSLLFIYSLELHKRDIENKKKINDLETRLSDIEKQIKLLLEKKK